MLRIKWAIVIFTLPLQVFYTQAQEIYLAGGNIINVKDGTVDRNMLIVVEDSIIKQIVKYSNKIKIPVTENVINLAGKYIIPGMIDAHIHFYQSGGLYTRPDQLNLPKIYSYEKDQQWVLDNREDIMRRYLACGITTIMDMGGPLTNFKVREYCDQTPIAPNALVTGPLISTYQPPNFDKNDPPVVKVADEEEAREQVSVMYSRIISNCFYI